MTPEEKIQAVVEAAGECWHERDKSLANGELCCHCSKYILYNPECTNPSPTDLNELFRLARKLNICMDLTTTVDSTYTAHVRKKWASTRVEADTAEEALLNVLYESTIFAQYLENL